jgi:hypothetical protein
MFELDAALSQWRQRMETVWRHDAPTLAELEDHLREELAALTRAGHTEQDAWRLATAKFGDPRTVARELAKVYRLSTADRAVLGLMIAAAAFVLGLLGWALTRGDFSAAARPLLATHIVTITLGYVAGLLAAGAAAYAIVRTLMRPASTAGLQTATLKVVRSASIVASVLSLLGFVLGAAWAHGAWGRPFSGLPKEIGALFVIAVFGALAFLAWRRPSSARTLLAIATCGGGIVLAAWFGAASMTADGAALFQVLGFGGLALSLALAALALTVIDRRANVSLD